MCERCFTHEVILYRVHTDSMEMKVGSFCAEEARRLQIPVDGIDNAPASPNQFNHKVN